MAMSHETTPSLRSPRAMFTAASVTARDTMALARPRITMVVALTAGPVLLHDTSRPIAVATAIGILLGVTLVGAGASALNAWYERDLDARMARTRGRPLPSGRLAPGDALGFGVVTAVTGTALLAVTGGALAAALGAATLVYYLVLYTMWAKPRTAFSTPIGAVAGGAAPVIADAAANGRVGAFGLALFAIIVVWQLPHVWAIALVRKSDYARAGIPLLPHRVGDRATRQWMLAWTLVLVSVSLLPWLQGPLGPVYALTALVLGAGFAGTIVAAMRVEQAHADRIACLASFVYVTALFVEMLVELALR